jgi:hypothetical protein
LIIDPTAVLDASIFLSLLLTRPSSTGSNSTADNGNDCNNLIGNGFRDRRSLRSVLLRMLT